MLKQSIGLPRLTKAKFLSTLAVAALVLTAVFSRADSDRNQSENNSLVGTWLKDNEGAPNTPLLTTYMSDGTLISTRTVILGHGFQLVSTGHGQWIRTGHNEFTSTTIFLRSGPAVEFTGFVKSIETITLNRASDQLTRTWTLYIRMAHQSHKDFNRAFSSIAFLRPTVMPPSCKLSPICPGPTAFAFRRMKRSSTSATLAKVRIQVPSPFST